ncbi:MFS transporter [Nocardiopsis salina]|uniref:MFS transporter n=1 Tax=Nocardiopsis salina TaxID=245836 RepID=UPI001EFA01AE|nr:MFS transporter [Nocardiopsis salina]
MQRDTAGGRRNGTAPGAERPRIWVIHPTLSFTVLGIVQITLIAAMTVIAVALPAIQRDLGLSASSLALVTNAYAVSFCGLLMLGGRLGDLFGLRPALAIGMCIFGVASLANAAATTFAVMLAARFSQGVGAALAAPAAMALVGVVFQEPTRRTKAIAIWGGFPVVGATLGILVSGFVANWISWRWAFVVPAVVVAVVLGVMRHVVPPGPAPIRTKLDIPGAVLVTLGLFATCYGLVGAGERGWLSAATFVPLGCGIALLASFILVEARARSPLVPLSFFGSRRRLVGLLGVMLASSGTFTTTFFLPLYFQQVQDHSPVATSLAFLPYGVAMFATGLFAGRLAVRLGPRTMLATGFAVGAAGLWLIGHLHADSPYAGLLLAGLVVFPVGAALIFSAATAAAMENVEEGERGLAGGVLNTSMEGGPTIGLAVLVSVAGAQTAWLASRGVALPSATAEGYGFAFSSAAVVYVVAALLAFLALKRRRSAEANLSDPNSPRNIR